MAQDLIMLTIIGGLLEVFTTKFATVVFNGTPFTCISLLIVFLAVARWNLWGLLTIPLIALTTMLGGMWSEAPYLAQVYDWHMYLATMISLCAVGINVIFYVKFTTKKVMSSIIYILLLVALDYVLVCGIQFVAYRLLCSGTLSEPGMISFTYNHLNEKTGLTEVITDNLCKYGENTAIYNLFGLAILAVGVFILRSQGIVCNVKQRFIDDKINADLDRADLKFTISEAEEETSGEVESEEKDETL